MARIAGVNIPTKKRVEIALTYIHGIGSTSAKSICTKAGVPDERRVRPRLRRLVDVPLGLREEQVEPAPAPAAHFPKGEDVVADADVGVVGVERLLRGCDAALGDGDEAREVVRVDRGCGGRGEARAKEHLDGALARLVARRARHRRRRDVDVGECAVTAASLSLLHADCAVEGTPTEPPSPLLETVRQQQSSLLSVKREVGGPRSAWFLITNTQM